MQKAILRDIHVTIAKPMEVGSKLYEMRPTITCVFELERTTKDIKMGRLNLAEGTWIVDTDNARHSIENIANIDLETMVRNRFRGINLSNKTVKEAVKDSFLTWCKLMTDENNRLNFLSQGIDTKLQ